ncbi:MAG: hypothetical protein OXM61_12535 [Candidatus Poribacteria bacterium]|nr:hypothetical protein [Candidatus Poribacteria bacterium]
MNLHEALEVIRQQVGHNEAASYTKEGCRVSMDNIPSERVVLDVDLAFPADRALTNQCDFVLFYIDTAQSKLVGVPMELKNGDVKASVVAAQLQDGARIVDNFTTRNIEIELIPVLIHDGIHKAQSERLKVSRIRFRGDRIPINTATCGYQGNIAEALKKSTKR